MSSDYSNDVTIHGYPPVGRINAIGTSTSKVENLPLDQFGAVDWAKMRDRQLRTYSTEALEAELARRKQGASGV